MKRKLLAGICIGMLSLSLVGCSSTDENKEADTGKGTEVSQETGFTGEKTAETKDGEDTVVTTVSFEDSKPVDVKIDVRTADGKMKSDLSKSGEYEMANATAKWHEQVETLEKFIVENDFDLSKITLSNDEGNTDAVSGVTIKVGSYLTGVEEALAQVK